MVKVWGRFWAGSFAGFYGNVPRMKRLGADVARGLHGMEIKRFRSLSWLAGFLLFASPFCIPDPGRLGQVSAGEIVGTVTDPRGLGSRGSDRGHTFSHQPEVLHNGYSSRRLSAVGGSHWRLSCAGPTPRVRKECARNVHQR
jgi:hypothetical protein